MERIKNEIKKLAEISLIRDDSSKLTTDASVEFFKEANFLKKEMENDNYPDYDNNKEKLNYFYKRMLDNFDSQIINNFYVVDGKKFYSACRKFFATNF